MNQEKKKEFIRALAKLLKEYDATIFFDCDESSDLYGITGERMKIEFSDGDTTCVTEGMYFSAYELNGIANS